MKSYMTVSRERGVNPGVVSSPGEIHNHILHKKTNKERKKRVGIKNKIEAERKKKESATKEDR